MSRFIYNGVELGYIRTKTIDHQPEYDDTGVDYLWTRVTFEIEAVMNALVTPSQGANNTPAQQIATIRSLLETPRKRLQFIVGSDTVIDTGASGRDSKSGPLPEPCTIHHIGGESTFLVSFRISTWINECPSLGLTPQYQSHRWKEVARIDGKTFLTKKTRIGKVYTRSDINANADALRGVTIPPLDNGFVLENEEFTLQEDGLALMYSWEEQEQYLMPPAPSTRGDGDYIESTTTPGGAVRFGECRVRLFGSKATDNGALLTQAIIICLNKISPNGQIASFANAGAGPLLVSAAVRQPLYDNQIEVTMKVKLNSITSPARTKQVGMDLGNFAAVPKGSEPGTLPPDPGTRGTANLQLFANFLQDPCSPNQIQLGSQAGQQRALSTSGLPEVQVLRTKVLPEERTLYSAALDNLPGFYNHANTHTEYKIKTWNAQLPTASPNSVSSVVTLASPTAQKIVEGSSEKVGSHPKIPDPNVNDSNLVPLEIWISPLMKLEDGAADGTMMTFRYQFRYVYAVIDVSQLIMDAGIPPFIDPQVRQLAVLNPQQDFIHGLIDGATGNTLTTIPGQTFRGGQSR